jgi:pseudaminic acid biosynthesis-associated methylase
MSETVGFWAGDFGNLYTERNRVDWTKRIPFWHDIIAKTRPASILDVGTGAGWNLRAIRKADPSIALLGVDVNQKAIREASDAGLPVMDCEAKDVAHLGTFDLVCTTGMLIHISGDDLPVVMDAIISASRRWVLAAEYADSEEVEVDYRGNPGKLWRRPFGELYAARGLTLVEEFDAPVEAFDRCKCWLMEKAA